MNLDYSKEILHKTALPIHRSRNLEVYENHIGIKM